jgi:hypothetical protein
MSEKNTSGTTSIWSALTNMRPIMPKNPPTICVLMKSFPIMFRMMPRISPAPIAIMI